MDKEIKDLLKKAASLAIKKLQNKGLMPEMKSEDEERVLGKLESLWEDECQGFMQDVYDACECWMEETYEDSEE